MTSLAFQVVGARPEPHAAVPTIMMRLRVSEATGTEVHALALRCQIRIEPQRRRYGADEEERLYELFGDTPRWGDTLRPFLWPMYRRRYRGSQRRRRLTCPSSAATTSR